MRTFNIEVTDTFDGEANYSWVRRYSIKAKTLRGAINKFAREYGAGWKKSYDTGDLARFDLRNSCVCAFVSTDWS